MALNDELIAVSGDASVGRRLSGTGSVDIDRLASTINRLFDALGERDERIQDRENLFSDFHLSINCGIKYIPGSTVNTNPASNSLARRKDFNPI